MGCDGSCCVAFPLNHSLDSAKSGKVEEGDLIAFMCRPLTHEQVLERKKRFGVPGEPSDRQMYRCVYWDETTRLCTIYDQRPTMCSDYPYPLNHADDYGFGSAGICEHGCDCQGAPLVTLGEN